MLEKRSAAAELIDEGFPPPPPLSLSCSLPPSLSLWPGCCAPLPGHDTLRAAESQDDAQHHEHPEEEAEVMMVTRSGGEGKTKLCRTRKKEAVLMMGML